MGFKGVYQEKSSVSKIGILFLLMIFSLILHTIMASALIILFFENGISVIQHPDLTHQSSVDALKLIQLFNGLGLFITPMLLYSYLTSFDFKFTNITRQDTILVIAIMMLITPFVALLLEWNMQIPFPDWIFRFALNSETIVEAFLKMSTIADLLYTLIVIAVVPAIGEELLFRGYLQKKIGKKLRNPQIAILITAFLFSLIHLDLQAFIPRLFLGSLLGYLYYWSKNLWIPILAHFVNNAQVVIFSHPLFKVDSGAYSIFSEEKINPMMGLFSFAAAMLLVYILYQNLSIKKG